MKDLKERIEAIVEELKKTLDKKGYGKPATTAHVIGVAALLQELGVIVEDQQRRIEALEKRP